MQLEQFQSLLNSIGLSKPSRFQVIIDCSKFLNNDYFKQLRVNDINFSSRLTLLCEASELPGKSFATSDYGHYGPIFQYPINTFYPEINLNFILSEEMKEKDFFDAWMYSIQDPHTNDLNYINNYVTDILISQLDQNERVTYGALLINAYPIGINQVQYNYGDRDSYNRLPVRFSYKKWVNAQINDSLNIESSFPTNGGASGSQPIQTFKSTISPKN